VAHRLLVTRGRSGRHRRAQIIAARELQPVHQIGDVQPLPPGQFLEEDPPSVVVEPLISLADLLEEGRRVRVRDVPVVDDGRLLEPLLRLLQRDEVARGPGLAVAGKSLELATQTRPIRNGPQEMPIQIGRPKPHLDMSREYFLTGSVLVSNWKVLLPLVKPP